MRVHLPAALLATTALVGAGQPIVSSRPGGGAQTPLPAVSRAEIDASLRALDVDRTTGGEGERQAYDFLAKKLQEYGVRYTR